MQREFWIERWREGRTGFHRDTPTPALLRFAGRLPSPPSRLLVPLCGKATDLRWLADRGHDVLGVELSRIACEAFFAENDLPCSIAWQGAFEVFRCESPGIELRCGDLFDLEPETLAGCDGVFDRAAVVALPRELRERYVAMLGEHLRQGTPYLLVSIERTQDVDDGPPFSLSETALRELYADRFRLEPLQAPAETRPDERGFIEVAYALERKN